MSSTGYQVVLALVVIAGIAGLIAFVWGLVRFCAAENVDKGNISIPNGNKGGEIQVGNPLAKIAGGRDGDMQNNWVTRTDTANRQRKEERERKKNNKLKKEEDRNDKIQQKSDNKENKAKRKAKAKAKANGTYEADKAQRKQERAKVREEKEEQEAREQFERTGVYSGTNPMHDDNE